MQRLFGVSLALSAEGELTREDRARSGGAPRVLAPDEFATYADDISPLQRSALEQSAIFFPYFAIGTTFDNGNARSRLSPAGIDVTPLAEYLERLLDFATRTRWGKRPVSRVEALAA